MRTLVIAPVFLAFTCLAQTGGTPPLDVASTAAGPPQIIDQGRDYRVWQWTENVAHLDGTLEARDHSYTELRSCLNYLQSGQWVQTSPNFLLTNGYAIATQCEHQVIVAPTLADPNGVVDLLTPDGQRLRSAVIALCLFDTSSGNSLQIATATDVAGRQTAANEITFYNAFDGLKAGVRLRNESSAFHQDILLAEQLSTNQLAKLGFPDPTKVRLEVWTEFLQSPVPAITDTAVAGAVPAQPGAVDEFLNFGTMSMNSGRAFADDPGALAGTSAAAASGAYGPGMGANAVPVFKQWITSQGRTCLIESANYSDLQPLMAGLPVAGTASLTPKRPSSALMAARVPPSRPKPAKPSHAQITRPDRAKPHPASPQLVLDYQILNNQALTNFTFAACSTYYISGPVTLYGATTWGPACTLKFATNGTLTLLPQFYTPSIAFLSTSYQPVVWTAVDDNTVGEQITGSTGNPTGYYASPALYLANVGTQTAQYLRVVYARQALSLAGGSLSLTNGQFVNCQVAFSLTSASVNLGNALFGNVATNLSLGSGAAATVQNATLSGSACLVTGPSSPSGASLAPTNCIFSAVTNLTAGSLTLTGSCNGFYATTAFGNNTLVSSAFPFQTVGAAEYYLPVGSPFHNAGTTSVDPTLLSQLALDTTYAPLYVTNGFPGPSGTPGNPTQITLAPVVGRDNTSGFIDMGYHYGAVDYLADSWCLSNTVVTVLPGTVIAWCFNAGGLWLSDNASIVCQGTPLQPVLFTPYPSVQEQSLAIGSNRGTVVPIEAYRPNGVPGSAYFRFANFNLLQGDTYNLYLSSLWPMTSLAVQDCSFTGGTFYGANFTNSITLLNNLFQGSNAPTVKINSAAGAFTAHNNLLRNATFWLNMRAGASGWVAEDNLLDTASVNVNAGVTTDHNAFYNCSFTSYTNGPHDQTLTSLAYAAGPLGPYYQATTNLLGQGSQTAAAAGLYHYTTQTNQTIEDGSIVAIGLHYVAVGTNGLPLDTNGDGIPDYLEDANGNGLVDSGEINWQVAGDLGLQVIITRPAPGSVLP